MKVQAHQVLPLFTQLANSQSQDQAQAECVAVIRENYSSSIGVGLENALHACWMTANPHGIRAVFALATKAQKLDRLENIVRDLKEKWVMWMEGENSKGLLPLYAEIHLDNDPTNFYKVPIAGYSSHTSMWENISPSRMLLECLDTLRSPDAAPLPAKQTVQMMDRLINTTLQPKAFAEIVDRLEPQRYPKELSTFINKFKDQSLINVQILTVMLKSPEHRMWENINVWNCCLALAPKDCLEHLSMNLRPAAFENYKKFGEDVFSSGGSSTEQAWRDSLAKRQSLDDAGVLEQQTQPVGSKARQQRL